MKYIKQNIRFSIQKVLFILILSFIVTVFVSGAKERQVTGLVSDDKNQPLAGVHVSVKNSLVATVTDLDGTYSIIATETDTLVFSASGFDTKQLPVGNFTVINVTLTETLTRLSAYTLINESNFILKED